MRIIRSLQGLCLQNFGSLLPMPCRRPQWHSFHEFCVVFRSAKKVAIDEWMEPSARW